MGRRRDRRKSFVTDYRGKVILDMEKFDRSLMAPQQDAQHLIDEMGLVDSGEIAFFLCYIAHIWQVRDRGLRESVILPDLRKLRRAEICVIGKMAKARLIDFKGMKKSGLVFDL